MLDSLGFSLVFFIVLSFVSCPLCFLLVPSFLAMSRSSSFFLLQVSSVLGFSGSFCWFCFGSSSFFVSVMVCSQVTSVCSFVGFSFGLILVPPFPGLAFFFSLSCCSCFLGHFSTFPKAPTSLYPSVRYTSSQRIRSFTQKPGGVSRILRPSAIIFIFPRGCPFFSLGP